MPTASSRPTPAHAGWSPFPQPEGRHTPGLRVPGHTASTPRAPRTSTPHRSGASSRADPAQPLRPRPSRDPYSDRARYTPVVPVSTTPPSSWRSSPAPQPRAGAAHRAHARPLSAEPRGSNKPLPTPRAESAQSSYSDVYASPSPVLRRKPVPLQPLRVRASPSSPRLNASSFRQCGAPRPAPSPPAKSSPVSQTASLRTSVSIDAAGNPRSFWDLESDVGDGDSDDEKMDLVRKVRSWSLSKRAGGSLTDAARADACYKGRGSPRLHAGREKVRSPGWRERVLCGCSEY